VFDKYIDEVKKQSLIEKNAQIDKNIPIIYSPLNGTGLKPVMRVLIECGYSNVTIVEEQMAPDGNFPTCPFPNPEIPQTMELGIKYAKHLNAGIVLATDPDCDRVGVFVKNCSGEYVNLTGNEIGILLLDYICSRRISLRRMPTNPIVIKTIVTTDMTEKICNYYGAKTISVLTGFKFIGEQIGVLESYGLSDAYIFGFEESNGFLSGTYVRDKDGVNGVLNICDMYAYYSSNNILLVDKLAELYKRHGYYNNVLLSYEFSGMNGMTEMRNIMSKFRSATNYFGVREIEQKIDYLNGIGDLPKSDMIKYVFNEKLSAVIRPSGTEPKMKIYISSCSSTKEGADGKSALLAHDFDMLFKQ